MLQQHTITTCLIFINQQAIKTAKVKELEVNDALCKFLNPKLINVFSNISKRFMN